MAEEKSVADTQDKCDECKQHLPTDPLTISAGNDGVTINVCAMCRVKILEFQMPGNARFDFNG